MAISLPLHLIIHLSIAIIVGYLIGAYYKKPGQGVVIGIMAGFLIDLDHVLEYFLFYGLQFNIVYFLEGREFLLSDKIYLWFHAWEYLPLLLIAAWLLRKKRTWQMILLTIACAGSAHLLSDCLLNNYPLKYYSLMHRAKVNFSASQLMPPDEYQKNLDLKRDLGLY